MIKKRTLPLLAAAVLSGCAGSAPAPKADAVMENILSRKSVRSYTDQKLTDAQIETLLRAAMAAPSGRNLQPWSFVVLTDPSEYDTIFEGNFNLDKFKQAAAVIVLCAEQTGNTWRDDLAAATENLLLAAESMGLGAVWTASYPYEDRYLPPKKALGLPDAVIPYSIVPVGYPAGDEQPKDKWDPDKVHYGRW